VTILNTDQFTTVCVLYCKQHPSKETQHLKLQNIFKQRQQNSLVTEAYIAHPIIIIKYTALHVQTLVDKVDNNI
jgi:hypothetical protein